MPYLVSNVIEILDVDPDELGVEEDGANVDLDSQRKGEICTLTSTPYFLRELISPTETPKYQFECCSLGKCAVIKTSTRQTYFLPVIGLVDPEEMKPGDLVGVNKVKSVGYP